MVPIWLHLPLSGFLGSRSACQSPPTPGSRLDQRAFRGDPRRAPVPTRAHLFMTGAHSYVPDFTIPQTRRASATCVSRAWLPRPGFLFAIPAARVQ
ncbi:hypothetical protein EJ04DRAFT_512939 [Polyplosphaeria fusca]|uniref:Secreted protein n=1 Tax=Polyplosphaeria fusca TaxID=682080 RepID=A0A9P4QZ77_9PLEO|nr:hypothetical protein EJ04DRAFT_512939 [Polyplosphaeria fusca]